MKIQGNRVLHFYKTLTTPGLRPGVLFDAYAGMSGKEILFAKKAREA